MIVADFLDQLCRSGKPVFENQDLPRDLGKPAERTVQALVDMDRVARLAAPHDAPALDIDTAHRATGVLLQLSRFFVFRELDIERIETEITTLLPGLDLSPQPATIWSIDLALQHLPNLHLLAVTADNRDPLIPVIRDLAFRWPLSGIGIDDLNWEEVDFTPVLAQECLGGILVDRVLETKNPELVGLPGITPLIREAVGDYEKTLAPWLPDTFTE